MAASVSTTIRKIALVAIATLMLSASVASAKKPRTVVTRENWPELTMGKRVLLLFTFPWCHHCRNFKPTWASLRRKYQSDDLVFLEVDCEDPMEDRICDDNGVMGVPHMRWGNTAHTEQYLGEFEQDLVDEFIRETVLKKPICSILNPENCPEEDRADMIAIDKLTTEFFEKINDTENKNIDPIKIVQQAILKNDIENPFWEDASGIHQIHGYQKEDEVFTSTKDSIKETVARIMAEDDDDTPPKDIFAGLDANTGEL